ncbi:uncharacterized protein LOC127283113, partial [Leptopilina boulardi]|uniref:uncharacterized protein LOC127277862 n=1 Tax=Leptopilina boulardi TaxID=63433 RepID=UPI0021F54089
MTDYGKERCRLKAYIRSGSAASKSPTVEWPYYNDMSFLKEIVYHMGYVETFKRPRPHPQQEEIEKVVEEEGEEFEEDIFSSFPIPEVSTSDAPTVGSMLPTASSTENNFLEKKMIRRERLVV